MNTYDFLKKVPLFQDLPEADLQKLSEGVESVSLAKGKELFPEGSPGDRAYVIQQGEIEILKEASGREVLLAVRESGEVIGEMALLEEAPRNATARARSDSVLCAIEKEQLDRLLQTSPSAAYSMFGKLLERTRGTEAMLRQSEKMAQLGTLTAGVAHELNNPAAAVKRGADQLLSAFTEYGDTQAQLERLGLTEPQQEGLARLSARARGQAARPAELDALARSDLEYELENWLEDRDVDNAWELAPTLVNMGYKTDGLAELAEGFEGDQLSAVIGWLNATYSVNNLLAEIGQGAGRISDIVKALKSYSYLDQAPVQSVDVHEGLDNTLLMLRSKLNTGLSVVREYGADLPNIQAYASELNQVWTNIIDNAADVLGESGQITIRTRQEGTRLVVEIEDDGPGIPEEIQSRVFESFFTTKPPGKGTGLGLDISYNIVVTKHRGDLRLESRPGKTTFQVLLPLNLQEG